MLGPGSGRAKRPSPATRWEQAREDYIGILIGVSADGIQIVDVDKVMKDVSKVSLLSGQAQVMMDDGAKRGSN